MVAVSIIKQTPWRFYHTGCCERSRARANSFRLLDSAAQQTHTSTLIIPPFRPYPKWCFTVAEKRSRGRWLTAGPLSQSTCTTTRTKVRSTPEEPSRPPMPPVDLDIVTVGDVDTCGTYVFNVEQLKTEDLVVFARQQLLKEVGKKGFNVLLSERLVRFRVSHSRCSKWLPLAGT